MTSVRSIDLDSQGPSLDRRAWRVFFGAELCEALVPTANALLQAYRAALDYGAFSYVTPPAGDATLAKLRAHFELLAKQDRPVEVIVNDWGVLRSVRETSRRLTPVLGRLMNKMLRDPRITPSIAEKAQPAAARVTRESALTSPAYSALLRAHGIETIELDNLHQGIEIDFASLGLRPSLHVPFSVVTTGPACFFAGMNQEKEQKFSNDTPCRLECQSYLGEMSDARSPDAAALVSQGNSVFFRQDPNLVEQGLAWAERHRARVVVRRTPLGNAFATDDVHVARGWLEVLDA